MKKLWWIIGGIGVAALFSNQKTRTIMSNQVFTLKSLFSDKIAKIRKDIAGDGHYGASRSNGTRKHAGIDLTSIEFTNAFSKKFHFPIPNANRDLFYRENFTY